jgi:hypothetical protein
MSKPNPVLTGTSILIGGLGLGWIMGLSVSPVVQTVIAALIAFAVAVATALVGIRSAPQSPPNNPIITPAPFGLLMVGIAIGCTLGVWIRTHDSLGPNLTDRVAQWKSTSYADSLIARRIFNRTYPPLASDGSVPKGDEPTKSGLYAGASSQPA